MDRLCGLAIDVGTTTLVVQLLDLQTGDEIATAAVKNPQAAYGDDVITRIVYASEGGGLERLHRAVIDNMNETVTDRYLLFSENRILTRVPVVPSMFTRDVKIIRQDCLGYIMESYQLPEAPPPPDDPPPPEKPDPPEDHDEPELPEPIEKPPIEALPLVRRSF